MVCVLEFKANQESNCLDDIIEAGHAGGLIVSEFVSLDMLFLHSKSVGEFFLTQPQRDLSIGQCLRMLIELINDDVISLNRPEIDW